MKHLVIVLVLLFSINTSFATGEDLRVLQETSQGGIWDHGHETYIVTSVPGFNHDKSFWGGFKLQSEGKYSGVIITDQFGPKEKEYAAEKILIHHSGKIKYFLLKVYENDSKLFEVILKKKGFGAH